jgi:hypothetical protein
MAMSNVIHYPQDCHMGPITATRKPESGVVITFSIDRWGIFQMLYHWAPSIVRFATL